MPGREDLAESVQGQGEAVARIAESWAYIRPYRSAPERARVFVEELHAQAGRLVEQCQEYLDRV